MVSEGLAAGLAAPLPAGLAAAPEAAGLADAPEACAAAEPEAEGLAAALAAVEPAVEAGAAGLEAAAPDAGARLLAGAGAAVPPHDASRRAPASTPPKRRLRCTVAASIIYRPPSARASGRRQAPGSCLLGAS